MAEPEAVYDYTDTNGAVLYQVVRFPDKEFRQRRPESGKWVWNLDGVDRVLYHAKALMDAPRNVPVWFPEGEKDVHKLEELGFVATTVAGGAGSPWLKQYGDLLAGRAVYLPADEDKPGRDRCFRYAAELNKRGCKVKIIFLPDLPADSGQDIYDWLTVHGHTKEDLVAHALKVGLYTGTDPNKQCGFDVAKEAMAKKEEVAEVVVQADAGTAPSREALDEYARYVGKKLLADAGSKPVESLILLMEESAVKMRKSWFDSGVWKT